MTTTASLPNIPARMSVCKAIIHEGARKGEGCKFPAEPDGYCRRHKRCKLYDERSAVGERLCCNFFRGCDNPLSSDRPTTLSSCDECREKKKKGTHCGREGCTFTVKKGGEKYCGKHVRDSYRDRELAEGITFCDIARGCFNICEVGKKSCEPCLSKERTSSKKQYDERKSTGVCVQCGESLSGATSRYGHALTVCESCLENQRRADEKRAARVRNYKEEYFRNTETHMNSYIKNSNKTGHPFELTEEYFKKLTHSACTYCGHYASGEANGIDRVDNTKGFVEGNVVAACSKCNRIKYI